MTRLDITPQERSRLRAQAHGLNPVVLIGAKGLTPSVLKETDHSLTAHALIKLRIASADRAEREAMLAQLCDALDCAPVHHLGRTLVLYRPRPQDAQAGNT